MYVALVAGLNKKRMERPSSCQPSCTVLPRCSNHRAATGEGCPRAFPRALPPTLPPIPRVLLTLWQMAVADGTCDGGGALLYSFHICKTPKRDGAACSALLSPHRTQAKLQLYAQQPCARAMVAVPLLFMLHAHSLARQFCCAVQCSDRDEKKERRKKKSNQRAGRSNHH